MLVDVKKICENTRLSRTTLYRYRKLGLPSIKVSGKVLFDTEEVIKWLKENSKS